MWSIIWIFIFIILATYLVISIMHMLGHALASNVFKAGMREASFGFGPKLFRLFKTKVLYRIPLIYCEDISFILSLKPFGGNEYRDGSDNG